MISLALAIWRSFTAISRPVSRRLKLYRALRAGPKTLTENSLQHLARSALRQVRFGKADPTRNLIVRHELPAVRDQLVSGELRPSFQDHAGRHQFYPLCIWNTENRYVAHG